MKIQPAAANDDWTYPGDVSQLQSVIFAERFARRATRHFQLGHTGQDVCTAYHVIGQEKLLTGQMRAETKPGHIGSVPVQQRVQCHAGSGWDNRALVARLYPVAFTRERIGRQTYAVRPGTTVELRPIDRQALDPDIEQLAKLAFRDPGVDRGGDFLVVCKGGQYFPGPFRLSPIQLINPSFACYIGTELFAQLLQRAHHQCQALVHRLATYLQRIGQVVQPQRSVFLSRGQERAQPIHLLAQSLLAAGRQQYQRGASAERGSLQLRLVFFDHHVRVRTARAERRNARGSWIGPLHGALLQYRSFPWRQCLLHDERRGREIDIRIQHTRMQARRELSMLQLQQHLRHARDAGRAFAMPDI
ncbi:hypothetical protein DYGSA30_32670 [Dyella sp. GSA-30]|nr:hypothetical protein DYGSA30_32670 [Dyella sp. GSA-30]